MLRVVIASVGLICAGGLRAHPEIEDALARLNARIAAASGDAGLYVERGELYARHEDWITAEANYLRAAELSPWHPHLDRARGALALATGRAAEARAHLNAALERRPDDAEALVLRARAHRASLQRRAAVADFNAALALIANPHPELFLERAALLPPADALRSLDDGIARLGPAITLHLRALALEESLGWIDDALARIDRIAGQSERKEIWLKRSGDLLTRAGRSREAHAAYASALGAIAALPDWLRAAPDTVRLVHELTRLTAARPRTSST